MSEIPSKRQQDVLDCIRDFIDEKGYGPTVREIGEMLNLSSPSTVHVHLKALEKKGLILRDTQKSRSIVLPQGDVDVDSEVPDVSENLDSQVISLPLVGNVAAGLPILAEQNIEDTIPLPVDIVGDNSSFLLSVRGDSMIEIGINDGDYVVVKEQNVADNGDIVVALIDDGATVKRFYKESNYIRLQPENSSMDPIITTDCTIVGKVVALFRRL